MKATKLLFGACALLAFSACSDDKDSGNAPDYTESAYIRVNILGNNSIGGRAEDDENTLTKDDFKNGTTEENDIKSAVLAFYDANGNFMSSVTVTKANQVSGDQQPGLIYPGPTSSDFNIEVIKTVEARVSLRDGKIPSFMMVYANPVNKADDISWSLEELKSATITQARVGSGTESSPYYYVMNNSVYFDEHKTLQRAVPVSRANFYQTAEEANDADEVNVYLDRVAAKVTLTQTEGLTGHSGKLEENGKTLKFVITGWGVNALAKKSYVTKRFGDRAFENISLPFLWNDATRYRSYWAMTPHYSTGNYPFVSDQVPTPDNQANNGLTLTYRPFQNLTRQPGTSTVTLENTVSSQFYNGGDGTQNTNAALISVVVAGYYTLDGNEITEEDGTKHGDTFYLYGDKLYDTTNMMNELAAQGAVVGKLSEGKWVGLKDEDVAKIFEIYHPTTPVAGDAAKGIEENKVTIRFKQSALAGNETYYYKNGDSDPVLITSTNRAAVNTEILSNTGLATAFTKGYAYFNVPIRHIADAPTGENAWAAGSFGVVRNHWYMVNIDAFAPLSLKTIGHGVFDPEKPVVPPSDPNDEYGIKANINVLSWRIVKHDVTLGE